MLHLQYVPAAQLVQYALPGVAYVPAKTIPINKIDNYCYELRNLPAHKHPVPTVVELPTGQAAP